MKNNIKFFFFRQSTWGKPTFRQQTPYNSSKWKNIESIDDITKANFVVNFNLPSVNLSFPPERILYFKGEPDEFEFSKHMWDNVDPKSHTYPISEYGIPAFWKSWKSYNYFKNSNFPEKKLDLSFCVTKFGDGTEQPGLQVLEGHKLRMIFLENFLRKYPNKMYLYGRNLNSYIPYQDFKYHGGELLDKWDSVEDFRYTLALENSWQNGLFTGMFTDPILAGSMPIYWGCPDLEKYFPKNSFIRLDVKKDGAIDELIEIIKSDFREQNLDEIHTAKELILDKYNMWNLFYEELNKLVR